MIHDLGTAEPSQRRRATAVALALVAALVVMTSHDYRMGLVALPFFLVILLVSGRVSLIRYDDIRQCVEIIDYCPWLPGNYRKEIPREKLLRLLCTIQRNEETESHELTIENSANEFIHVFTEFSTQDSKIPAIAKLLGLEVTVRRL
jgi:hypothetical protein